MESGYYIVIKDEPAAQVEVVQVLGDRVIRMGDQYTYSPTSFRFGARLIFNDNVEQVTIDYSDIPIRYTSRYIG